MIITITLTYALILSSLLILLTIRVLDLRKSPVTRFLHKKDRVVNPDVLSRAIRGHGNLTEYAPTFLILMLIAEINGLPVHKLYLSGTLFTLGRISHAICFGFLKKNLLLRIVGMFGTISGFITMISSLLFAHFL